MNEAETGSVDLKAAQAAMKSALSSGYDEKTELDPENLEESLLDRMPDPTGWRILILPYRAKSRTDKGLYLPQDVQHFHSGWVCPEGWSSCLQGLGKVSERTLVQAV